MAREVKEEARYLLGSPASQHIGWTGVFYFCPLLGEFARAIAQVGLLADGWEVLLLLSPLAGLTGRKEGSCRRAFALHAHTLPLQRPIVCFGGGGVLPGPQHEGSC